MRNSQRGGKKRGREVKRRERGETVGLVTRCVLLLLYGGLLHHQNIKCPAGKRAYAWVHPHFTFTANCQLNRATFPRFLAPENVLIRPSRILFLSLAPSKRGHRLPPIASFSSTRQAHAFLDIANFIRRVAASLVPESSLFALAELDCRHTLFGSLSSAITATSRIGIPMNAKFSGLKR